MKKIHVLIGVIAVGLGMLGGTQINANAAKHVTTIPKEFRGTWYLHDGVIPNVVDEPATTFTGPQKRVVTKTTITDYGRGEVESRRLTGKVGKRVHYIYKSKAGNWVIPSPKDNPNNINNYRNGQMKMVTRQGQKMFKYYAPIEAGGAPISYFVRKKVVPNVDKVVTLPKSIQGKWKLADKYDAGAAIGKDKNKLIIKATSYRWRKSSYIRMKGESKWTGGLDDDFYASSKNPAINNSYSKINRSKSELSFSKTNGYFKLGLYGGVKFNQPDGKRASIKVKRVKHNGKTALVTPSKQYYYKY